MFSKSKMIKKDNDPFSSNTRNEYEDEDEDEDMSSQTINIVDYFKYNETSMSKEGFKDSIRRYMKALTIKLGENGKSEEEIQAFKAKAVKIADFFLKRFDQMRVYYGESCDPDSMIVSIYPEDGTAPDFYYIMDGLRDEKYWSGNR